MKRDRTKLVEEGNTIYEIDLDCMERKEMEREKAGKRQKETSAGTPGENVRRRLLTGCLLL